MSPYEFLVYKWITILDKCETLEGIDHDFINEDLLSKLLMLCKLEKSAKHQKEWLNVIARLSWCSLKYYNENSDVNVPTSLKRIFPQILEFLQTTILESQSALSNGMLR